MEGLREHTCGSGHARDIDGAQAKATKYFTTNRVVNPLDPRYSLPSYEEYPTMSAAQLRETNHVGDIYGAHLLE